MAKILINVNEVMEVTGLSKFNASKLIREVNLEMKKKGFTIYRGKAYREYLLKN